MAFLVQHYNLSQGAQPGWRLNSMPRDEWFGALFIIGCINGLGSQVIGEVSLLGWADAALSTFGISAIVWVACYAGVRLILEETSERVHAKDIVVGLALVIPIALPFGGLSWLAISVLSFYVFLFSVPSSPRRSGAIILLAATIPMFWNHLLFRYLGDAILRIDALLVGLLLGTGSHGNIVPFVDGSGSMMVLPGCSSLPNVWLAFLSWALITQWQPRRWAIHDFYCCFVAVASVVSANLTRIGLMGMSQAYYSAIHSPWGNMITNLLMLGLIVGICLLDARHETNAHT